MITACFEYYWLLILCADTIWTTVRACGLQKCCIQCHPDISLCSWSIPGPLAELSRLCSPQLQVSEISVGELCNVTSRLQNQLTNIP